MGNGVSTDDVPIDLDKFSKTTAGQAHFSSPRLKNGMSPRVSHPTRSVRAWAFPASGSAVPITLKSVTPQNISEDRSYLIFSISAPSELHSDPDLEEEWQRWGHFIVSVMTPRGITTPVSIREGKMGDLQSSVWVWNGAQSPFSSRRDAILMASKIAKEMHKNGNSDINLEVLLSTCTAEVNKLGQEYSHVWAQPSRLQNTHHYVQWHRGFRRILGYTPLTQGIFPHLGNHMDAARQGIPPISGSAGNENPSYRKNMHTVIPGWKNFNGNVHENEMSMQRGITIDTPRGIKRDKDHEASDKLPVKRGSFELDLNTVRDEPSSFPTNERAYRQSELDKYRPICSEIIPGLYVSGYDYVAKIHEVLVRHGITHVLNTAADICESKWPQEFKYLTYYLKDTKDEDVDCIFYKSFDFIEEAIQNGGRVLIHCSEGVSRSATITIGYLMHKLGIGFTPAFHQVKNKRFIVNPNTGFSCQLIHLGRRLRNRPPDVQESPAFTNEEILVYRVKRHNPKADFMVLDSSPFKNQSTPCYDPRFAYLLRKKNCFIGWIGQNCTVVEQAKDTMQKHVQWVTKYEDVNPNDVQLLFCNQNAELKEFMEWNGVGPDREGFVCRMCQKFDEDLDLYGAVEANHHENVTRNPIKPLGLRNLSTDIFTRRNPQENPSLGTPRDEITPSTPCDEGGAFPMCIADDTDPSTPKDAPNALLYCADDLNDPINFFDSDDLLEEKCYILVPRDGAHYYLWIGKEADPTTVRSRIQEHVDLLGVNGRELIEVSEKGETPEFWDYFEDG